MLLRNAWALGVVGILGKQHSAISGMFIRPCCCRHVQWHYSATRASLSTPLVDEIGRTKEQTAEEKLLWGRGKKLVFIRRYS